MTDTITNSFCERCGTRYTFDKAEKPRRARLGRVRVLTRGLTTFVANDGLPMAEAMAAARNDEERAQLSRQLDVFHETFNFCMTCRQYTCPSCWNEAAAECLTCAPDLSREVLPPAFPDLPISGPDAGDQAAAAAHAAAWPSADLDRAAAEPAAPAPAFAAAEAAEVVAPADALGSAPEIAATYVDADGAALEAGAETEAPAPPTIASGAPSTDLTADELVEIEGALAGARSVALRADAQADLAVVDAEAAPDATAGEPALAEADAEPAAEPPTAPVAEVATEPLIAPVAAGPVEPHVQAAVARDQTRSLLRRFRPGRGVAAAAIVSRDDDGISPDEPRPASAADHAGLVPTAAADEPEPAGAAPEPQPPVATPDALPAPLAAESAPMPAPDRTRTDAIRQPTWQMVAPDAPPPGTPDLPGTGAEPNPAAWPTTPGWSSRPPAQQRTPGPDASPWAARLAGSRPETGGVWAASSREVLGGPAAPGAVPAVQACVSCGLSLSATARFCRRCGARQG